MNTKKTDLRVVKTLNNIQASFLSLLETKKLSEITVKEICDLAQCSRNTFYAHYTYKEDLYEQLVEDNIRHIIHGFRILEPKPKETVEQLVERYIHNIITSMYESKETIRKLTLTDDEEIYRKRLTSAVLEHMLTGPVGQSETAAQSEEYALMCGYCSSGLVGFLLQWIMREGVGTKEAEEILKSLHTSPFCVTFKFIMGQ